MPRSAAKAAPAAAPVEPVAPPAEEATQPEAVTAENAADLFGDLEEEVVQGYDTTGFAGGRKPIDWEAETPAFVKDRVNRSYEAFLKAITDAGKTLDDASAAVRAKANQAANRRQAFKTEDQVKAFLKAAAKYATFKDMTFKGAADPKEPLSVVYRVRDKITHKSVGETLSPAAAAGQEPATAEAAGF